MATSSTTFPRKYFILQAAPADAECDTETVLENYKSQHKGHELVGYFMRKAFTLIWCLSLTLVDNSICDTECLHLSHCEAFARCNHWTDRANFVYWRWKKSRNASGKSNGIQFATLPQSSHASPQIRFPISQFPMIELFWYLLCANRIRGEAECERERTFRVWRRAAARATSWREKCSEKCRKCDTK